MPAETLEKQIPSFETRVAELTTEPTFPNTEAICQTFNLLPEQAEAAVNNAEAMKDHYRVAVRMPKFAFESMLEEGGTYKTSHETNYTMGNGGENSEGDHNNLRLRAEEKMGIYRPGEPNIVYGYLEDSSMLAEKTPAWTYGGLALILKPEVTDRATFTLKDSLRSAGTEKLMSVKDAAIAKEARDIGEQTANHKIGYVEAQILGGVSLDDVEAISITMQSPDAYRGQDKESRWQNLDQIEDFLKEISAARPEMPLVVRMPAYGKFPLKVFELAEKYPEAIFIGVIDNFDSQDLPFAAAHMDRTLADMGSPGGTQQKSAEYTYERAKDRQAKLEQATAEQWQARGHEGQPANIQFVTTRSAVFA